VARQQWLLVVLTLLLAELVWVLLWALDRPLLVYLAS
jgi:hypothetical protein